MEKQAVKHGFALIESRRIEEIDATASLWEHQKSGARLLRLKCDDNNKLFSAAFKTVPTDSTGCPHILEHSVLNGSKNFPAKSTFMELIKGSLNTFINAMTDSDMTLYPVGSTNAKDFINLSRVYLDAVFFPNIYDQPNILHQEGWHYELTSPEDELKIRGVVYNEMRGAFSSPDAVISRLSLQTQFPDNTYGVESGGDPKVIPQLTNEAFLDFHRKHYHPSNSYIFLYGDEDADAMFEIMDVEYLSKFERSQDLVSIEPQKPFDAPKNLEVQYPVEEGKDITHQYHLSLNFTYGQSPDLKLSHAINTLISILMWTPASPLKLAILKSGLARDTSFYFRDGILQPTFSIVCKQLKQEDTEAMANVIRSELERLVEEGIDKKLIEAVINRREFMLREGQMSWGPKGLYHAFTTYSHWMHGGDPLEALGFEESLIELRRGLTEPYFEELIKNSMLNNKHASQILFVPVPGLANRWDVELKEELATQKAAMSKVEIDELVKFNAEFLEWQKQEPSVEDLEKIPVLSLEDIDKQAESYHTEVEKQGDITLLKHQYSTNGIVYLRAYFDLAHAPEADLPWISLYNALCGQVDSQNLGYAELSNEVNINTGVVGMILQSRSNYLEPDQALPKLIVFGKVVSSKIQKFLELAAELALRPVFGDRERLGQLIREIKSKLEARLFNAGHGVAIDRMLAPFSQLNRFNDLGGGLSFYKFLCDLEARLDEGIEGIIAELERVQKSYFLRKNLLLSITSDEEGIAETSKHLKPFVEELSSETPEAVERSTQVGKSNEGILAPVQVQHCAKGGSFFRKGFPYSGKLQVLKSIISNEFLHRELREKGGAYGAWAGFQTNGNMFFCSFRDPNLRETLETYDRVGDFIRNFDCSRREMDKFIIGEISALDYPLTPERKGIAADEDYITGFTQEDRQQIRDEVLSSRVEDIRALADLVEAVMQQKHLCVFGNEAKLKEAEELFDRLTPLFG